MYCPNCGARNDRTATSCVNCGVALQPTGAPTDSTATEGSGTAPTPPSPPASSGETYSPPDTSQSGAAEGSGDYGSSTQPQDPSSQPTAGGQESQPPAEGFGSSTPPPDTTYEPGAGSSGSGERREYAPSSGTFGPSSSAGGASYTGPASGGGVGTQVPNRLVPAIVLTVVSFILAFFTFGITGIGVITGGIAIVFAAMVNGRASSGDIQGAQQASRVARILNLVTIGIVVLGVIVGIILIVLFVLAFSAQGV